MRILKIIEKNIIMQYIELATFKKIHSSIQVISSHLILMQFLHGGDHSAQIKNLLSASHTLYQHSMSHKFYTHLIDGKTE